MDAAAAGDTGHRDERHGGRGGQRRDASFASARRCSSTAREFKERGGCYAEYLAAREDLIYPLPEGVDLDQAAGLANYQVAWHLLNSALKGFQYDSALVVAAAGGVGTALVQLAKAAGKRVIGVVSSDERAAFARAQGADDVVDRKRGDRRRAGEGG